MNQRDQALDILRRARDLLAERLTERVLESRDELLAEGLGLGYTSEIDALYEELGIRLARVNSMLSNLPAMAEPPEASEEAAAEESPARVVPALPAPRATVALLPAIQTASIHSVAGQIQSRQFEAAGQTLAVLFDVSPERGVRCAQTFYEGLLTDSSLVEKAARLHCELTAGSVNGAIMLLWQCFGLYGMESIRAVESLRSRLAPTK